MSIKTKYILFIGLLHTIMALLVYYILREQKWIFIASELVMLGSLYASYLLYKALIKPIDLMQSGTDAIMDKDFSIKYLKTGSKEVDKLVNVFNTMIDNLRSERISMSEQSYFVQNLLEASPLATVIEDIDGLLQYVNPAAQEILGINDDYREKRLDYYPSLLVTQLRALISDSPTVITINGVDKYKCQITDVVHQGHKRRFILIDDLSTELLATEKQAFGQIIRMMAHEVNNSMGAVNSIIDTVLDLALDKDETKDLRSSLQLAVQRNKSLGAFMDNYASILRLPSPTMKMTDLGQLLQRVGRLYIPMARGRDIGIDFQIADTPIVLLVDPVLIEQAVSNMIKNSIESIGENGDIVITAAINPTRFTVKDSGAGIAKEIEHNLFTPFFSTKPKGQGVGLMLIRDILVGHKVDFSLTSNRENGWTTFEVVWPR